MGRGGGRDGGGGGETRVWKWGHEKWKTSPNKKNPNINSHWLVAVRALELLGGVLLVTGEEVRSELDVSWLVDTVDVTETGSDGEAWGDLGKSRVDLPDVLRLGVEGSVVDGRVVDTVLLTTGDTDLHLEPDCPSARYSSNCALDPLTSDLGHSLKVLHTDLNVLLLGLLGHVQHVGGEQGLSVLLVVGLVGIEHTIEPWKELLGAVVRVENDGDTVVRSDSSDVVGGSGGTGNRSGLVGTVGKTLTTEESGTSLGDLEDDG